MNTATKRTAESFNRMGADYLPGYLGIEILSVEPGRLSAQLPVKPHLQAPNGYLRAGSVISLADTAAGCACMANMPEGATQRIWVT